MTRYIMTKSTHIEGGIDRLLYYMRLSLSPCVFCEGEEEARSGSWLVGICLVVKINLVKDFIAVVSLSLLYNRTQIRRFDSSRQWIYDINKQGSSNTQERAELKDFYGGRFEPLCIFVG